ncbi:hypothetical protein [Leptospira noguchii]
MFLTEKTSNRHSFRKFNLVFCMVLIDSSKPRKVFYQAIELLKKASLKWPFNQDLKKEIELLSSISFKKNVSSPFSHIHDKNYAMFILVKETYDSIQELKLEIHSLANNKESDYYRQELASSSRREIIYVIIISAITLVSLLNIFAFYFLIQKKKQ